MAGITYDQFLTASTLALQRGAGGPASGVQRDWVTQLLPAALNQLAVEVAEDPARRPLLLQKIEVDVTRQDNGTYEGAIDVDAQRQVLYSALCYSSCFDLSLVEDGGSNQPLELLYKEDWRRVVNTAKYMNPAFAYYSLRDRTLVARPSAEFTDFGPKLTLYAPSIPDFNTVPLVYELVDDAQAVLWKAAAQFLTAGSK
jgi:hypothetical protein